MPINIGFASSPGSTFFATAERLDNGQFWNVTASAWQASPSTADRRITLTEGTGINAGSFAGSAAGMGDAGVVRVRVHDDAADGDTAVTQGQVYVWGGDEVGGPELVGMPADVWAHASRTITGLTQAGLQQFLQSPTDAGGGASVLLDSVAGVIIEGMAALDTGRLLGTVVPGSPVVLAATGAWDSTTAPDRGLTPTGTAAVADRVLGRSIAGGSDGGRTVEMALAGNVNRVEFDVPASGQYTVYDTDDTTVLFTGTYTRSAAAAAKGALVATNPT